MRVENNKAILLKVLRAVACANLPSFFGGVQKRFWELPLCEKCVESGVEVLLVGHANDNTVTSLLCKLRVIRKPCEREPQ